jgi:hypothetical protein
MDSMPLVQCLNDFSIRASGLEFDSLADPKSRIISKRVLFDTPLLPNS